MLVQSFATLKASARFSLNFALMRIVPLLFAAIVASDAGNAAPDEKQEASNEIRHSDLSVYRTDDGTLKPIRTTGDWELRRTQIIKGAEAAMGEMPGTPQPPFDSKVTEDVRIGDVRRITIAIAMDDSDRLPIDLYLPKSLANIVDVTDLFNAKSPSKLAAIVALHPT